MKKLGIYDPYLHILGGAEKYIFTIALCLASDYEITLFTDKKDLISQAERKFGINLLELNIKSWTNDRSQRINHLKHLDMFLYVTDGSLFYSPAKCNLLLIQTPLHIPTNNLFNKIKLWRWQKIICYSQFMAKIISKRLNRYPDVLFVPIQKIPKKHFQKKNLILSVGRFFPNLHNKKQLELVYIFKGMVSQGLKNTELVLVGSVDPGGESYLDKVKQEALGFPIKIITDAGFEKLQKLYQEAKIYWHGTGYGENLELYPEKAEHFGVATVEAMQYGAVPVVFAGGGQTEIVENNVNGILWNNSAELVNQTNKLLKNEKHWKLLSETAIITSQKYSQDKFCQKLREIIKINNNN